MKFFFQILFLFDATFIIGCKTTTTGPDNLLHSYITQVSSGTTKNLFGVYFIDPNTGFVVGDSGTLLKTTNSGLTWTSISTSTKHPLYDVFFFDADTGIVCGDYTLFRTTNGGNSWTKIDSVGEFRKISFFNNQSGFISGYKFGHNYSGPLVRFTNDGGKTWVDRSPNIGGGFIYLFAAYSSFYDSEKGFIQIALPPLDYASIYKTTDGGMSWDSVYHNQNGVNNIFCVSSTLVFATGDSGLVLKSTDFGSNWTTLASKTTASLGAIYFTTNSNGYIIGDSGTIISTSDGGSIWASLASGTNHGLYAIYFPSPSTGFIVGQNGTILKIT